LTGNVLTHSSVIRLAKQALLDKKAKQWTASGTKEYDVVKELFGLPAPKQGAASRQAGAKRKLALLKLDSVIT
jgi:hypothetical protein